MLGLIVIIISALFNILFLGKLGVGNSYYAAGIKSMMSSLSNFFFLSFDGSGFISIDKAPLSLWVDTIFAKIGGFSGIAIMLPHAIEGIVVSWMAYKIAMKFFDKKAALLAGLIAAMSPVNVAVYRNNTPDALLLVFMQLAIWQLMNFVERKEIKNLLWSAVFIGLGFNTKMLQAYLLVPAALVIIFVFGGKGWIVRIRNSVVFLATTVLMSVIWISIVDLTPASLRPFVGGSENNSAWNLALGYNGSQRLLGENGIGGNPGFNVGEKGIDRLFSGEMGTQIGWMLLSILLFSLYFAFIKRKEIWNLVKGKNDWEAKDIGVAFNIGLLLTEFGFFCVASFFHSYYLNVMIIPIAFLMAGLADKIIKGEMNRMVAGGILGASVLVQISLISEVGYATWLIPVLGLMGLFGGVLIGMNKTKFGVLVLIIGLMVAPGIWSGYTTVEAQTGTAIFIGGPSVGSGQRGGGGMGGNNMFDSRNSNQEILNYLEENYDGEKYFLAVSSQQQATDYILNQNILNIMTLGGFSGRDQAISLEDLKEKINNKEIRFFLIDGNEGSDGRGGQGGGMFNANSEISSYVSSSCQSVDGFSGLYDCQN